MSCDEPGHESQALSVQFSSFSVDFWEEDFGLAVEIGRGRLPSLVPYAVDGITGFGPYVGLW